MSMTPPVPTPPPAPDAAVPQQPPAPPQSSAPLPPLPMAPPAPVTASYQLPPMPARPTTAPAAFVQPVLFPSLNDRIHRTNIRFKASLGTFLTLGVLSGMTSIVATVYESIGRQMWVAALGIPALVCTAVAPYAIIAAANGSPEGFGMAIRRGFRAVIPGIAVGILQFLTTLLPFFLLFVPAFIMGLRFALASYVIVNEGERGLKALARSRDLVYGRTLVLFGNQLVVGLIVSVIALLPVGGMHALGALLHNDLISDIGSVVVLAAAIPYGLIFFQTFYEDSAKAVSMTKPTPAPTSTRLYAVLAVLGTLLLAGLVSLPFVLASKLKLKDALSQLNAKLPHAVTTDTTPLPVPNGDGGVYIPSGTTPVQRDQQRRGDVTMLRVALDTYFGDQKQYPETLDVLVPKYLKKLPTDPSDDGSYPYERRDATYVITFTLEQGIDTFAKGAHTVSPNGFDVTPAQTPPPADDSIKVGFIPAPEPAPEPEPVPTNPLPSQDAQPPLTAADTDGDGLTNDVESAYGTNPNVADTDGDGLSDFDEVNIYGTDPLSADTDKDTYTDGSEVQNGFNPTGDGPITDELRARYEANRAKFAN